MTLKLDALEERHIVSARLLNDPDVDVHPKDDRIDIAVPEDLRDPVDTIVERTLDRSMDS